MAAVLTFGNDFRIFFVGTDFQGRCPVLQVYIFQPFFIRHGFTLPAPSRVVIPAAACQE
jgi:hypothetical protein